MQYQIENKDKMEDNILKTKNGFAVIEGGNPVNDCPRNWDHAESLIALMNEGKEEDEPQWSFDCGFKLDYDGQLMTVSSRFYPPKTHYGLTWDGDVTIYFLEEEIVRKKFDCQTLPELKTQVEEYVQSITNKIKSVLTNTI